MSTRIINLRTRRKQKARDERRKTADDAALPGVTRIERDRAAAVNRQAERRLDDHRREDDD